MADVRAVRAALAGVLVALLCCVGDVAAQSALGEPINTLCPVMTDEEVVAKYSVEYRGQVVGLCCAKCQRKFNEDPSLYIANLPLADPVRAPGAPLDPEDTESLLARMHPLFVHFPIALLLAAALAEALAMLRGKKSPAAATAFCVRLAAAGAMLAAWSGWGNAEFGAPLPGTEENIEIHRWLGVATLSVASLLALASLRAGTSPAAANLLRWGLFVAAPLVAVTGHFGGTLVYGADFPFG
ncbi:MAG: DUF2231 domain-containing protein [Planctomycetota bacterium]